MMQVADGVAYGQLHPWNYFRHYLIITASTMTKKLLIAVGCPISICLSVMPTEDMYSESIDLMSQFSARRYPAQDVPQHS